MFGQHIEHVMKEREGVKLKRSHGNRVQIYIDGLF